MNFDERMIDPAAEQDTLGAEESVSEDLRTEYTPIPGIWQMSEDDLKALSSEEADALRLNDIFYLRDHARAERRDVSYGELRLMNALVAARRENRENYVISRLRIFHPTVAATYEDLAAKAASLELKGASLRTVEEVATVGERYMKRIGRGDDRGQTEQRVPAPLIPGSCFVLITPAEDAEEAYEENLAAMLRDREISTLYERRLTVGAYGIMGTLSPLCDGVFADLRMLTDEEAPSLLSLSSAHVGRTVLTARREAALWICRLAQRFGLRGRYFAKTTDTGRFRTDRNVVPSVDWSMDFLRGLLSAKEPMEAVLASEDAGAELSMRSVPVERMIEGAEVARAIACDAEENCFFAAVNTAVAAVTDAVSRGVDRRRVGMLVEYQLPMKDMSPEELGNDLAAVLGVYRVAVELAAPQRPAEITRVEDGRRLICTAYSPDQGKVPLQLKKEGNSICLLSYGYGEDGMPDFDSLRKTYDQFIRLYREGRIYSAKAVNGDPYEVLDSMTREFDYMRESSFGRRVCRGILIETDRRDGMTEVARVAGRKAGNEQ